MAHPQKYNVALSDLSDAEREQLSGITRNYRYSQRERNRAQILLLAAQGQTDSQIAAQVGCHAMTARNVRWRFCQNPLPEVDTPKHRVKRAEQTNRAKRAFDGQKEAHLVALACSTPPEGAKRWTLQLLHDRLIEMQILESVGKETIRRTLKKTTLSPG
jgi:DNA-binding CsgD family transcriptional regulator